MSASAKPVIPADIAKTVVNPSAYGDPAKVEAALAWLRANMPLGVAQVEGYDPIWIVTKHADILAISRNPGLYTNTGANPILNDVASEGFMRSINNGSIKLISSLTFMDPPEHTGYRNLTQDWFQPANISDLEADIRALARRAVTDLMDKGDELDFLADFALLYPLRVVMTLFGVPPEDEPRMLKLTQEFFGVHDPDEQRQEVQLAPDVAGRMWHASLQDFYSYFNGLSESRRREPRNDLLSLIANAKIDGKPIPEAEANGYYVAIATAGHDTTSSSVAGGLLGLAQFPDQWARLKADLSLIPTFVDECIRWTSPVKHFMRTASAATELREQAIEAGDRFMLCYLSANRDEEVFKDPDVFDVGRKPNRHLAFGWGPHGCLGQHLAKLEMRILFEELLPHIASIEVIGEPSYVKTNFVGGLKRLPMRLRKERPLAAA